MLQSEFLALPEGKKYEMIGSTENITDAIRYLWFLALGDVKDYHQTLFEFLLGDFPEAFDDDTGHWFDTNIDDCQGGTLFVGVKPEGWFREREEIWQMETASEFERDKQLLEDLRRKFHLSMQGIIAIASGLPEVIDLKNMGAERRELRAKMRESGNLSAEEMDEVERLEIDEIGTITEQVRKYYLRIKLRHPPSAEQMLALVTPLLTAGIDTLEQLRTLAPILREYLGNNFGLKFSGKFYRAEDL